MVCAPSSLIIHAVFYGNRHKPNYWTSVFRWAIIMLWFADQIISGPGTAVSDVTDILNEIHVIIKERVREGRTVSGWDSGRDKLRWHVTLFNTLYGLLGDNSFTYSLSCLWSSWDEMSCMKNHLWDDMIFCENGVAALNSYTFKADPINIEHKKKWKKKGYSIGG